MGRVVVALGGNALLKRGEEMTADNQRKNAKIAAKALAPLGIMDLGVREGAALVVMGAHGIDGAVAVQASLLLFAMNVLPPSLSNAVSQPAVQPA